MRLMKLWLPTGRKSAEDATDEVLALIARWSGSTVESVTTRLKAGATIRTNYAEYRAVRDRDE